METRTREVQLTVERTFLYLKSDFFGKEHHKSLLPYDRIRIKCENGEVEELSCTKNKYHADDIGGKMENQSWLTDGPWLQDFCRCQAEIPWDGFAFFSFLFTFDRACKVCLSGTEVLAEERAIFFTLAYPLCENCNIALHHFDGAPVLQVYSVTKDKSNHASISHEPCGERHQGSAPVLPKELKPTC